MRRERRRTFEGRWNGSTGGRAEMAGDGQHGPVRRPSVSSRPPGQVLRDVKPSTRAGRAAALTVYFEFLELRHKVEIYNLTGQVLECPLDEMNRPRVSVEPQLRIPPAEAEMEQLFAGWREELATCRKFAPAARNYAVARLAADVGLRINEARMLDLDDVRWELGRYGKLNVRHGKGSRRRGRKPPLVPRRRPGLRAGAGSWPPIGGGSRRRGPRPEDHPRPHLRRAARRHPPLPPTGGLGLQPPVHRRPGRRVAAPLPSPDRHRHRGGRGR